MAWASSEDSDQLGHPPSLTRVFVVRMKKAWVLSYPLSGQWRLCSDWANAQADLSLCSTHSLFVGFVVWRLKCRSRQSQQRSQPYSRKKRKREKIFRHKMWTHKYTASNATSSLFSKWVHHTDLKDVKKVRSAIHRRLWKNVKQNIAEKFSFSLHMSFPVQLYSIWNLFWLYISSQNHIFLGYCLLDVLKNPRFFTPSEFFFQPGNLIHVSKDHIGCITNPFRFSLPISKVLIEPAIAWQWLYAGYPHFAPWGQKC